LCIIVISPLFAQTPSIGYKIGDTGPGGGIVFSVRGNKYMEVSPILGEHGFRDAISIARNYRGGGFTDWRLPTQDELNQIYRNLRRKGIGDLGNSSHWSSRSMEPSHAWIHIFGNGVKRLNPEDRNNSVRAVRGTGLVVQQGSSSERAVVEERAVQRERINRERREAEQNRIAW
jgi:hypothetical protein